MCSRRLGTAESSGPATPSTQRRLATFVTNIISQRMGVIVYGMAMV